MVVVTFHRRGGGRSKPYLYEHFPASAFAAWKIAPSAGKWFNANLRREAAHAFGG